MIWSLEPDKLLPHPRHTRGGLGGIGRQAHMQHFEFLRQVTTETQDLSARLVGQGIPPGFPQSVLSQQWDFKLCTSMPVSYVVAGNGIWVIIHY